MTEEQFILKFKEKARRTMEKGLDEIDSENMESPETIKIWRKIFLNEMGIQEITKRLLQDFSEEYQQITNLG